MQISISNVIGRAANLITYAARLIKEFKARVATYPGSVFEAQACLTNTLNTISRIDLLNDASLIITPTAYNETKLYSVVPNTTLGDMDVVRATTATRVNELGLIEIVPRNLLTYSGDFSDASWVKAGGATITLSTIEPPFPNVKTYNLTNIGDSLKYISKDTGTIINASYSFYLKAIDASDIGKTFGFKISNSSPYLSLELTDEWQRIDVFSSPLTGNYFRLLSLGSEATTKVCIAAAQLEQGSLTEYFPTTTRLNIPRIDYTNGTCPSLLVEPQRTNLFTYSEQFNDASWKVLNSSVTANNTISPDGTTNADKFIDNTTNGQHILFRAISFVSGTSYSFSVFVKAAEITSLNIYSNVGVQDFNATYNLTNETATAASGGGTARIINYGNGWYRCIVSNVATATISANIQFRMVVGGSVSFTGTGTQGLFLYGAQLEAGSYASSYIPSVASTVTRNADVISKTGISSLIGQTEGAIYAEINFTASNLSDRTIVNLSDNTNNNWIFIRTSATVSNGIRFRIANSGSLQFDYNSPAISTGLHKVCLSYKLNNINVFIDGVKINNSITSTIPLTSKLNVGCMHDNSLQFNDRIKSALLFKTALTDQECIALTTL